MTSENRIANRKHKRICTHNTLTKHTYASALIKTHARTLTFLQIHVHARTHTSTFGVIKGKLLSFNIRNGLFSVWYRYSIFVIRHCFIHSTLPFFIGATTIHFSTITMPCIKANDYTITMPCIKTNDYFNFLFNNHVKTERINES